MYKIQEETNVDAMKECLRLGKMHYDEVFQDKVDKVPRNYNWQFLNICLENGLMHIITARDDSDNLIGYFVNLVSPDMFSSTFQAKELAIFVNPANRKEGVFDSMRVEMESLLKRNGVASQFMSFQKGHNDEIPLKSGYRLRELVYEKVLVGE